MNTTTVWGNTHLRILFIVLMTGGVLAGAITTFRERPRKQRLQSATEMISGKVLLTRQKAAASKSRYRIHYSYEKREFRVYKETTTGNWRLDPPDNRYELPDGVLFSTSSIPNDGLIIIDAEGTIENGGEPVWLRLADRDNTQRSIRINEAGMVQELPGW
jgi:hypothetical protein